MMAKRRMIAGVLVLAALFTGAGSAGAWQLAGGDVQARLDELGKAWAGKPDQKILKDKMKRSKQKQKPDWAGQRQGRLESGGKTFVFASGVVAGVKEPGSMVQGSQRSAETFIAARLGDKAGLAGAVVLDWFRDDEDKSFYTLMCAEAPKLQEAKPPKASKKAPKGKKDLPAKTDDLAARIELLKKAGVEVGDRSGADGRPAWSFFKAWKVEAEGKTYLIGVGRSATSIIEAQKMNAIGQAKINLGLLQSAKTRDYSASYTHRDASFTNPEEVLKVNEKVTALAEPWVIDRFQAPSRRGPMFVLMSAEAP